jgi:hypothetical protein
MRASSLSNGQVIELLNHYYVPVYLRNEDCADGGSAPPEVKEERNRIYRDALKAGLSAGTVCAYLLTPEAQPVAVAPLNQSVATDPERLSELMQSVIDALRTPRGEPLAPPSPQSAAPPSDAGSLVLHLTARYLERTASDFVPVDVSEVLGTRKAGNWGNLPSEDWVVLGKSEWMKLLPAGDVRPDSSWELNPGISAKLLKHFFPPTENTNVEANRIDEQVFLARTESVRSGIASVRLEGRLKMKHPFYHQDDSNFVEATLKGYMEIDVSNREIRSLQLVTDAAVYGGAGGVMHPFGVAVRSQR